MRCLTVPGLALALTAMPVFSAPAGSTDDALARAVSERLGGDPELAGLTFRVDVADRIARLSGTVPALRLAWRVERVASSVRGLRGLESALTVRGTGRDDARIAADVRAAFRSRPRLEGSGVRFTVEKGRVRLEGELDDPRTRFIARDAAAGVRGVVAVDDRLRTAPRPDDELLAHLEGLFRPGPYRPVSGRIRIAVHEGAITLSGTVPRVSDRLRAVELALGVAGVVAIANEIEVEPPAEEVPVVFP